MTSREDFKSFIPASKSIPELTIKAVAVGALLAIVLGAAVTVASLTQIGSHAAGTIIPLFAFRRVDEVELRFPPSWNECVVMVDDQAGNVSKLMPDDRMDGVMHIFQFSERKHHHSRSEVCQCFGIALCQCAEVLAVDPAMRRQEEAWSVRRIGGSRQPLLVERGVPCTFFDQVVVE